MSSSARSSDASRPAFSAAELEERFEELIGAVLSSRRTAGALAQALAARPRALQDFVLHWVAVTAKSSPELAYQFAALAPAAVAELGQAGAERWLLAAMDVYDREGLYRAAAELKDLAAYVARVRDGGHGVAYDEVSGVLELFVAGLAGRRLRLEPAEAASTDTATIYLPARIALFPTRAENFRVYKVMAALMWAQTRYGTFNLDAGAYPGAERDLAVFNVLETLRLAARLERTLPGLHRDLAALACPAPGPEFAAAAGRLADPQTEAGDSAALAATIARHAQVPAWPFLGSIDVERSLAVRADRMAREKDALRTALARLQDELRGAPPDAAECAQAPRLRLEGRQQPDGDAEISLTFDGRPVAPPAGLASLVESVLQDGGRLPEDCLVAAGEGPYSGSAQAETPSAAASGDDDEGALRYDEWDFRRQHYRKRWCVLRERDVHPGDPGFVPRTLARYRPELRRLRRSFEMLRGEDKRLRGEPYGDDFDLDAVVRARAELRAGAELSERVFARRAKHERDLAVLVVVDMSGSTKGWINDCERAALVLLAEALEVLGDRYAIYGFSGVTHKRCEVYRVKRFDEAYDELVRGRIAGIQPLDYTRMGAAIRHLSGILAAVEARTRLLVTLSDGKPDDFSDGYRGEYGIEDTRQALIEAKRAGIHPFCITIDRDAATYLPRMYGAARYTVIEDVARLPTRIAEVYRRLTT
jgi:nitric oxide reductase NorD protein